MSPVLIGMMAGGGILAVLLLPRLFGGGGGEGKESLKRRVRISLKALVFSQSHTASIATARERSGVVWEVSPSSSFHLDRDAVTRLITHPMKGFLRSWFRPKREDIVAMARGDGFPLVLSQGAAMGYRKPRLEEATQLDLADVADRVTKQDDERAAEASQKESNLTAIGVMLFFMLIAGVGVFVYLLIRAQSVGMI